MFERNSFARHGLHLNARGKFNVVSLMASPLAYSNDSFFCKSLAGEKFPVQLGNCSSPSPNLHRTNRTNRTNRFPRCPPLRLSSLLNLSDKCSYSNYAQQLNIFYQNCRGFGSKISDIYENILSNNYDIILLAETRLTSGAFDSKIFDSRYSVFRQDRDLNATGKTKGEGVIIGIKTNFNFQFKLGEGLVDAILIQIHLYSVVPFVCVIYFPPNPVLTDYLLFYSRLLNSVNILLMVPKVDLW